MNHLLWANFQSQFSDSVTSIPRTAAAHLILHACGLVSIFKNTSAMLFSWLTLCCDAETSEGRYYLVLMHLHILWHLVLTTRQHTVKINLPSKSPGTGVRRRPCLLNDMQTLALVVYFLSNILLLIFFVPQLTQFLISGSQLKCF